LLLENHADPNILGGRYNTALHAASYRGWLANVRLLLEHNADPNLRGENPDSTLGSLNSGRPDIATVLLAHGAEPENMSAEIGRIMSHFRSEFRGSRMLIMTPTEPMADLRAIFDHFAGVTPTGASRASSDHEARRKNGSWGT
ncbi:hypothetical protein C8J57DRAFT_1395803, partial [Mycena rebaudengoi]